MEYSIKPPDAFLWKTGYNEEGIRNHLQYGKVAADWLVCPHGSSAHAVTVAEFLEDPSILNMSSELSDGLPPDVAKEPHPPMSVAVMGWSVFSGALVARFLLTLGMSDAGAGITSGISFIAWISTLLSGIEALIIAGAITALLGHAWNKLKQPGNEDGGVSKG